MRTIPSTNEKFSTPSKPIQIIVTPGSGNGRALDTARRLRDALRTRGHRAKLEVFADLDSLHGWAATGESKCSLLISVGGDGTQDTAALAGIRRSVPLLPVPSGFGNLFTRALRQPGRVDRVIDLLEHGEIIDIDVGVRKGQTFVCQESFGLLNDIENAVADAGRPRARWQRCLAYYQMAAHRLWKMPLTPLRVTVDGRVIAKDAVVVTVANVETYGPWLNLTPAASPIDGLFDVFVMRRASKREILARLLARQLHLPSAIDGASVYRGQRVSVAAPHQATDELSLMPQRLRVVVSPATAEALRDLAARSGLGEPGRRQVA